jgi:hypothetical protein
MKFLNIQFSPLFFNSISLLTPNPDFTGNVFQSLFHINNDRRQDEWKNRELFTSCFFQNRGPG